MGLNETHSSDRVHIGFFGRRNAGKSSVVNAVTGQELSVVSDVLGTTTDPVYKSMELLPLGPVMIIDTPGIDDVGELGEMRVLKTEQVLNKIDVAVLVVDTSVGISEYEKKLINEFKERKTDYIIAYNKSDLKDILIKNDNEILVSAKTGENIEKLKEKIANLSKKDEKEKRIVADLIDEGDFVLLVTPIDEAAPKGRLILPQQQTIRDILDKNAYAIVVKETGICDAIKKFNPSLVVCDSQVFKLTDEIVPKDIRLTSFSILMARYKGNLLNATKGAMTLDKLSDNDLVLISEGCTHHRQCNDIGTVKIPKLIKKYTNKDIKFEFTSGGDFPKDLSKYKMVIHCGGCMLNER
ncbi:MAG: [Clostridia bacterium]|nr:[FeFe] hydrogenase H-cluster maturation GTPase HydF [Clostridia bacterium]